MFGGIDPDAKDSLRLSGKLKSLSRYGVCSKYSRSFFWRVFEIFLMIDICSSPLKFRIRRKSSLLTLFLLFMRFKTSLTVLSLTKSNL